MSVAYNIIKYCCCTRDIIWREKFVFEGGASSTGTRDTETVTPPLPLSPTSLTSTTTSTTTTTTITSTFTTTGTLYHHSSTSLCPVSSLFATLLDRDPTPTNENDRVSRRVSPESPQRHTKCDHGTPNPFVTSVAAEPAFNITFNLDKNKFI